MKRLLTGLALWGAMHTVGAAVAEVLPDSYAMLNGQMGAFSYWDDSYDGAGNKTQDLAPLSGGTGDLTDGVVATQNWNATPGPYVGWESVDPFITFTFGAGTAIDRIDFHFDDADSGGVGAPSGVRINGVFYPVFDPAGPAPFLFTVNNLGLTDVTALGIQVHDNSSVLGAAANWVFISEIDFFGTAPTGSAPAPAGLALLGLGSVAIALRRRRRTA